MNTTEELVEQFTPDLSFIIDQASETPVTITLINYNQQEIIEKVNISAADCQAYLKKDSYTWIHVQGAPKSSMLREFGKSFKLHPLALEDIINTGERSKTEAFDNQILIILGLITKKENKVVSEQVSLFLGENFLVSFHNGTQDPFRAVRRRLHHPQATLRSHKLDYLLYVLVDVVVDQCFPILEALEDELEKVEQELLGPGGVATFMPLYTLKRELLVLGLKLRPQREAIRVLMRDDCKLFSEETKIYLRDCYDHIIRLNDILEIYRNMTSNMLDVHLSLVNHKTFLSNEVQRKATVWAMLFAPLTFITGIYGMNFINMPEAQLAEGYAICLSGMAILGIILAVMFKKKGWL